AARSLRGEGPMQFDSSTGAADEYRDPFGRKISDPPDDNEIEMPEQYKSTTDLERAPVIEPGHTFGTVTEKISAIVLTRPASNGWFIGFGICFMLTMMMLFAIGYLFVKGIGIWGVTIPIGWGFAIVNFVWWIGIGHAGTLISAI